MAVQHLPCLLAVPLEGKSSRHGRGAGLPTHIAPSVTLHLCLKNLSDASHQVVYEWGLDVSASITSVMRKKQAQSPSASPRIALTSMPSPKPPGLQRSSSGFSLNKLIKGLMP